MDEEEDSIRCFTQDDLAADIASWTDLHLRVWAGDMARVVDQVVEHPDLINQESRPLGLTPLHIAVLRGNEVAVGILLNHGADINARDATQSTPVIWAAKLSKEAVLRLLVRYGADVTVKDEYGRGPFEWIDLMEVLLSDSADDEADGIGPFESSVEAVEEAEGEMVSSNEMASSSDDDQWDIATTVAASSSDIE